MLLKLNAIGFLAKDAIINSHNSNNVINFTIAVNEKFKKNGEAKEQTTFINCAYWTDKTTIAQYLVKGVLVQVCGRPESKLIETADGRTYAKLSLKINEIDLLSSSKKQTEQ